MCVASSPLPSLPLSLCRGFPMGEAGEEEDLEEGEDLARPLQ